ncbi:MAG: hypothetical protein Q4B21_06805 [Bacteroidia bacterium]|nr:hypothetical protein [Bacteroidia bacterium]
MSGMPEVGIFDNFHNREHTYNPSSIERFVDAQDRDYATTSFAEVDDISINTCDENEGKMCYSNIKHWIKKLQKEDKVDVYWVR